MANISDLDPLAVLESLGGLISPALTGGGPLVIDQYSCVLCPGRPCECAAIEFGSPAYFAKLDRAHGRNRGQS
jgi:hypothetical protein